MLQEELGASSDLIEGGLTARGTAVGVVGLATAVEAHPHHDPEVGAESDEGLVEGEGVRRHLEVGHNLALGPLLLGINGGFGNTDVANLPRSALDSEKGVVSYARPKTGIERVVPPIAKVEIGTHDHEARMEVFPQQRELLGGKVR